MPDAARLGRALRSAVSLRDQVLVLRIDAESLHSPPLLASLAETVALLRALELRPLLVVAGVDAAESLAASQPLLLAIQRQGQKAVALSATGMVSLKKLLVAAPPAATATGEVSWSATPELVPLLVPLCEPLLLTQLLSLRYIPLLLLPATDDDDCLAGYPADDVAALLAKYLAASQLVFFRPRRPLLPPRLSEASSCPQLLLSAQAPERLLSALFPSR